MDGPSLKSLLIVFSSPLDIQGAWGCWMAACAMGRERERKSRQRHRMLVANPH